MGLDASWTDGGQVSQMPACLPTTPPDQSSMGPDQISREIPAPGFFLARGDMKNKSNEMLGERPGAGWVCCRMVMGGLPDGGLHT